MGNCEQPMNRASHSGPIVARAKSRTCSAVMRPSEITSSVRNEFDPGNADATVGQETFELGVDHVGIRRDDGDILCALVLKRMHHRARGGHDRQAGRVRQHGGQFGVTGRAEQKTGGRAAIRDDLDLAVAEMLARQRDGAVAIGRNRLLGQQPLAARVSSRS